MQPSQRCPFGRLWRFICMSGYADCSSSQIVNIPLVNYMTFLVQNVCYFCRCSSLCFIKPPSWVIRISLLTVSLWSFCIAITFLWQIWLIAECQCVAVCYSVTGKGLVLSFFSAKHLFVGIQLYFDIHLVHTEKCRGMRNSAAVHPQQRWFFWLKKSRTNSGRKSRRMGPLRISSHGFKGILAEFSWQTATNPVC